MPGSCRRGSGGSSGAAHVGRGACLWWYDGLCVRESVRARSHSLPKLRRTLAGRFRWPGRARPGLDLANIVGADDRGPRKLRQRLISSKPQHVVQRRRAAPSASRATRCRSRNKSRCEPTSAHPVGEGARLAAGPAQHRLGQIGSRTCRRPKTTTGHRPAACRAALPGPVRDRCPVVAGEGRGRWTGPVTRVLEGSCSTASAAVRSLSTGRSARPIRQCLGSQDDRAGSRGPA